MPAVRRSGFVSFGNADIIKVHSQRVNGRMCAANEKTEKFNLVTNVVVIFILLMILQRIEQIIIQKFTIPANV